MRKVTALAGQSVFDVALIYCGDAVRAWDIARENGLPITTTFELCAILVVPDDKNNLARNYEMNGNVFATGISSTLWILNFGIWNDEGVWMDGENWID